MSTHHILYITSVVWRQPVPLGPGFSAEAFCIPSVTVSSSYPILNLGLNVKSYFDVFVLHRNPTNSGFQVDCQLYMLLLQGKTYIYIIICI